MGHLEGENDNYEIQVLCKSCSYHWEKCPEHIANLSGWSMSSYTPTPAFMDRGHLRGKITIMRYKCFAKVVHTIEQLSWTYCQSVRMIFVLLGPNFRLYGQGASWHGKWQLWDPCAFKSCSHHWDSCPEHVAKLSGLSMIPLRPQLYTSWTGGILAGKIPFRRDKCLAKVVPTGCLQKKTDLHLEALNNPC